MYMREKERDMEGERGRGRDLGITSPSIPTLHTHRYTHTKKLESRVLSVSCAYLLLDTPADPRRETACLACRLVILGRALTASYAVLDISSKNGRAFLEYERTAGARAVLRHCCLFRACIMSKSRVTYAVACEACWEYIRTKYVCTQGNLVSNILRMNTSASAAAFSGAAFSEAALASASAFA